MLFKPVTLLLAASAAFLGNVVPVEAQVPRGTVILRDWFVDLIPTVFPNTTTHWVKIFEDGTLADDIVCQFNTRTLNNKAEMRGFWTAISHQIEDRISQYVIQPKSAVAFAADDKGREGWVIATGDTWLRTKQGRYHAGGSASAWVSVKWDHAKKKRVITEWKEVNTPPNYPNYPWN
ncbi:hypothetical protein CC1G_12394 [Coprinopsis cinerea okayama7|uniref:SnoaL-like domain-containing protein n=1 Tax=Coprinopsis cinerea (strain Okayama-7 / 130 / ATCC MYA-4618 / FGSC 9003) TaxID=240176 RepID=A8P347_COPC7|nr:hypothetical protein CC1G_12394 [Coprinopsis cinerea okayama7\|eukprot:XP_001838470.1 hypothetical protein CC1G_12394 [Coprinopsis cinerea okayama7\